MKKIISVLLLATFFCVHLHGQIPIPENGCYHAAFTGNDTHQQFAALAKKEIAIEMFFTGWPGNKIPDFPISKCNEIVSYGAIPHVTWMPQVSGFPYPLDGIIDGSYDNYITGYAAQVKNWGKPLFIRLGHEFNGDWYTYGGAKNGGGKLDGFGNLTKPDGPERFIAAFKRVHDLFKSQSVTNVVWIWSPNNSSSPNELWNAPENYYPGDDYVDWIGFDGYNFGSSQSWSGWMEFWDIYKDLYQKFENYNKPLMIAEYASVEIGGNKADWIRKAYTMNLKYSFPKIKAVTWFHIKKIEGTVDTDWRINSSDAALKAYQDAIADPYYLSRIITNVKEENNKLPAEFFLEQNYPNPFNPETVISYRLSAFSKVSLKIFDILGREVATLVNEEQEAGIHNSKFSPPLADRNPPALPTGQAGGRQGSQLSSGVYFYRLNVVDLTQNSGQIFSQTKKMLLLK